MERKRNVEMPMFLRFFDLFEQKNFNSSLYSESVVSLFFPRSV